MSSLSYVVLLLKFLSNYTTMTEKPLHSVSLSRLLGFGLYQTVGCQRPVRIQCGPVEIALKSLLGCLFQITAAMSAQSSYIPGRFEPCTPHPHRVSGLIPQRPEDLIPQRQGDLIPQRQKDSIPQRHGDLIPQRQGDLIRQRQKHLIPQIHVDSSIQRVSSVVPGLDPSSVPRRLPDSVPLVKSAPGNETKVSSPVTTNRYTDFSKYLSAVSPVSSLPCRSPLQSPNSAFSCYGNATGYLSRLQSHPMFHDLQAVLSQECQHLQVSQFTQCIP